MPRYRPTPAEKGRLAYARAPLTHVPPARYGGSRLSVGERASLSIWDFGHGGIQLCMQRATTAVHHIDERGVHLDNGCAVERGAFDRLLAAAEAARPGITEALL